MTRPNRERSRSDTSDYSLPPGDHDYMRNGRGGGGRYFYPVSHTNYAVFQTWDTPYEYGLLRSHAVADDLLAEMAAVIQDMGLCGEGSGHERGCRGCEVIARYQRVVGVDDAES